MLTIDPGFQLIQARFPHIAARLVAAWGQKGFASYIDGLLQTRREGQALGFPPEIIAALNELRAWHARVHDAEESEPAMPAADVRRLEADANFRVINQCHPHIGKKLKDAWATCLFSPFINELFRDSRGGTRQGFAKVDIYKTSFRPMKHTLSGRDERTLMKLVVDGETHRVLGCHICGPDAGEMVQLLGIAVKLGAKKADFDATLAVHPTAAEELVTMREKWTGS